MTHLARRPYPTRVRAGPRVRDHGATEPAVNVTLGMPRPPNATLTAICRASVWFPGATHSGRDRPAPAGAREGLAPPWSP